MQKTHFYFFVVMMIVLNQLLPLALSQLTIRLPTQEEGKQTVKESVTTSGSLSSNQVPVKNVGFHEGSQSGRCQK